MFYLGYKWRKIRYDKVTDDTPTFQESEDWAKLK